MSILESQSKRQDRAAAINMSPEDFREIGHNLIDAIADFLKTMPEGKVTPSEEPVNVKALIDSKRPLPNEGSDPKELVARAAELMFNHSLFNGHPRFWGYITASPAPIGMLGDLLGAATNPNLGSWTLGPMATEIELQTVRWISELIGYPTDCGGLLVSGGNMANFVGFLAARRYQAKWNVREQGMNADNAKRLCVYSSAETHTWIQKAADLFGLGTDVIRWIPTDESKRMRTDLLKKQIELDLDAGSQPFLIVGTAGSVSTGAVDPLYKLAETSREYKMWFHVDGAYGGFAAKVKGVPTDLAGLSEADSVAVDPHKWLYAPIEAGCALVRKPEHLLDTFSYHPPYYHFDKTLVNFVDYGMQNSRGFRALKVWLALQQVGKNGYYQMISDDIRLAELLYRCVEAEPSLQAFSQGLSITTFRYVPSDLRTRLGQPEVIEYLNKLNEEIMLGLEKSGTGFVSQAIIEGNFALRACIVNFRTSEDDIRTFPPLIADLGKTTDRKLRPMIGASL